MKLCLVEEKYFKQILNIDFLAFSRNEPRSLENIENLNQSAPEGCFAALEGRKVIGFVFCKVFGNEGFIGPIGVHPDFQGQGYGKMLLQASVEYLKNVCPIIGLEVNPSRTRNIYIYHHTGFITAFPTLVFNTTGSYNQPLPSSYEINTVDSESAPTCIDKLESWINEDFNGTSYGGELERVINHNGILITATENGRPAGFIAYCQATSPFAWGAVKNTPVQSEVLKNLINSINTDIDCHIPLAVNGKFTTAMKLLSSGNYSIRLSMNRMLLKGYEGDYYNTSNDIMLRAWMN